MTIGREVHGEDRLALRWTVGDGSPRAYEALRLSLWGAWRLFGSKPHYVVCVRDVGAEEAARRTGAAPPGVRWLAVDRAQLPDFLEARLGAADAESAAWAFAPLRLFPDHFELAFDAHCILWQMPDGLSRWLADGRRCVIAEDVRAAFGCFADQCGAEPRSPVLRGLPPRFDLGAALRSVLAVHPDAALATAHDARGLQVAAASRPEAPYVVRLHEMTVCSPAPPHVPHLGRCGAYFAGLDAGPDVEGAAAHFDRLRETLLERVGLVAPPGRPAPRIFASTRP